MNKIEAKNVNVFYGEKQALFDINMDIQEKQVTALIGPSGCGKSTFLRCLNRMNDVIDTCKISGKILMDNTDIYGAEVDPVELRAKVGMVFQKSNPFPKSIFQNIVTHFYHLPIITAKRVQPLIKAGRIFNLQQIKRLFCC